MHATNGKKSVLVTYLKSEKFRAEDYFKNYIKLDAALTCRLSIRNLRTLSTKGTCPLRPSLPLSPLEEKEERHKASEKKAFKVRDESSCGNAAKQFPRVLSCDKSKPNIVKTQLMVSEGCSRRGVKRGGGLLRRSKVNAKRVECWFM